MYITKIYDPTYRESCGVFSIKSNQTILYEDNAACIAQIKWGYIKWDSAKHIYTHEFNDIGMRWGMFIKR